MPIAFVCGHCGAGYTVGDEWAGRDVTCRACATVIRIPIPETPGVRPEITAPQPGSALDSTHALPADEPVAEAPALFPRGDAPAAGRPQALAWVRPVRGRRRSGEPFDLPGGEHIDRLAAPVLLAGGYGLVAVLFLASGPRLRDVLVMAAYAMVFILGAVPIAALVVQAVANAMRFEVREQSALRLAAALGPTFLLGWLLPYYPAWTLSGVPVGALIGLLAGLFLFTFMFRTRPLESLAAWAAAIAVVAVVLAAVRKIIALVLAG